MNISNLKKTLSELSSPELMELMKLVRAERRISKKPPPSEKVKKSVDVSSILDGMSKEDKLAMLAMLEEK